MRITLIGKDKDSFKKFYEEFKPFMLAIIKSLPTKEEIRQRMEVAIKEYVTGKCSCYDMISHGHGLCSCCSNNHYGKFLKEKK